jgi:hypothetical protein
MDEVALLILFNHNYESNFGKLEAIYGSRFKNIFFIMPFYQGDRKDVITVYENSYYFHGYIAKALEKIKDRKYAHYIVIGDDLLLNPGINEKNYKDYFNIDNESAFIPRLYLLNDLKNNAFAPLAPYWEWNYNALDFKIEQAGLEIKKLLPSFEEALKLLKRHNLSFSPKMPMKMFYNINVLKNIVKNKGRRGTLIGGVKSLRYINKELPYPMVGAYSDIVVVPNKSVARFISYCGIFASMRLFVEIGLPTALCFSVDKIIQEKDMDYRGELYWEGDIIEFEKKHRKSLNTLITNFPAKTLVIHPVKFSKWN